VNVFPSHDLKGEGKPLTDNQIIRLAGLVEKKNAKPTLSEGAKTFCQEIFNQEFHGRRNTFTNKFVEKGLLVEEKAITIYSKYKGKPFVKNKERFTNEYLSGEPDELKQNIDIKSSWDINTFPMHDTELTNNLYKWQVKGYCFLLGKETGKVAYCLVNTPDNIVMDEKFKMARKLNVMELPPEIEEEVEWMHNYDDLSFSERVREFEVEFTEQDKQAIIQQVTLAREYLNQLVKEYQLKYNPKKQVA